ncbi:MAG: hypothetical protein OEO79_10755 [Gemmatimonadota bacterium]|nr:hypothetical protein [Gemmatimonadota bacterium]MDH3422752.1 hypothetical protein [Gemmatimonadota bacterium]
MRITVWLAARERDTWVTGAEALALALILWTGPGGLVRLGIGLPLLAHIAYRALTSLPMGAVPRRPERGQARSHYDLRARIVRFLDEVRRAEDFAQRARVGGSSKAELEQQLWAAQQRVMLAATEVAKATGQAGQADLPTAAPVSRAS